MASEMLGPPLLFELPMNELNAVVLFHVVIVVAVMLRILRQPHRENSLVKARVRETANSDAPVELSSEWGSGLLDAESTPAQRGQTSLEYLLLAILTHEADIFRRIEIASFGSRAATSAPCRGW